MYQVLLVDDEPIILSGIKYLIDWEKNGCQVVDTARNGKQALEKIRALSPDIVICDIAMPVITGTELLALAAEESPDTVFIMLTNHPDFDLARESLRFKAVDYLLKSQLVAETLEASLARACRERDKRTKLTRVELVDSYLKEGEQQALQMAVHRLTRAMAGGDSDLQETAAVLERHGVTSGWGMAYIPLDFSRAKPSEDGSDADRRRLCDWQRDMLGKLAENLFPHQLLFCPNKLGQQLFLLAWGLDGSEWETRVLQFTAKAQSASATITQAGLRVTATDFFRQGGDLAECRRQLVLLQEYCYLEQEGTFFRQFSPPELQPLHLSGFGGRLTAELRSKNPTGVAKLLERASAKIRDTAHEKGQAEWLCGEICAAVDGVLGSDGDLALCRYWEQVQLLRRSQALHWLELLQNELAAQLEQYASGKQELIEKAKQYVLDNVEKKIMLQDVADYVCISPGYLSALFKKMYNQNFSDYINHVKMERACELIREGRYRIYEISDMLSFENAYYFSQVFKRHIGMTPTGYQKKIRRE